MRELKPCQVSGRGQPDHSDPDGCAPVRERVAKCAGDRPESGGPARRCHQLPQVAVGSVRERAGNQSVDGREGDEPSSSHGAASEHRQQEQEPGQEQRQEWAEATVTVRRRAGAAGPRYGKNMEKAKQREINMTGKMTSHMKLGSGSDYKSTFPDASVVTCGLKLLRY